MRKNRLCTLQSREIRNFKEQVLPPKSCLQWLRELRQWRICLQCKRPGLDPWVGKIPWKREWLPTPVFLSGEFHRQKSLVGSKSMGSQRIGHNLATKPSQSVQKWRRGLGFPSRSTDAAFSKCQYVARSSLLKDRSGLPGAQHLYEPEPQPPI